ncbi:metal-dependent transcriptional regulator [Corynebacterium diphtheriae]|nr:metal-dependent transcriptional regulator [Corynebacterium diphtheriae]
MHVSELPEKSQDYLKNVWDMHEATGKPVSLGELASRMSQKTPTASEAVKKLVARGLLDHERYGGIMLTEQGEALAKQMVRRHRLVEMFLFETLGFGWDEVHEEAEILEHAMTDKLLQRIDDHLGNPSRDPHGDPIPSEEGIVDSVPIHQLGEFAVGEEVIIERIHDRDANLLRYLAEHGVLPGVRVIIGEPAYPGMNIVKVDDRDIPLAESSLWAINARKIDS